MRRLLSKSHSFFLFLIMLVLQLLLIAPTLAEAQDNSYVATSVCGTEQGNYEFGVYLRIYGAAIRDAQDIIIDDTDNILTADRLSDEGISIFSNYFSLKGAIGAEGATELLTNAYPIINNGLDQVGINPYDPVTQHAIEYIVGAGGAIASGFAKKGKAGAIVEGSRFAAEEAIYTVRDIFFLVPLWSKNKGLRTLNAVQSIAFPYFQSCRDYSYVVSQFGYSGDYPQTEAEFFDWMLERIEEGLGNIDKEEATNMLLLYSAGVRQTAASLRNGLGLQGPISNKIKARNTLNSSAQGDPVITGVTPTVLVGSTNEQTITVRGVGFSSSASLRFNDGSTTYDRNPEFINASTLRYDINVGTEAADWTVQVRDGSSSSAVDTFEVKDATYDDETAPEAPLDLTISEQDLTAQNGFDVFWDNPSDPSGIAKVWYKIGDIPTHSEDGTSLNVQRHNPFSIIVETGGETSVHVWLEDNLGNKNHYNRSTAVIQRDDTAPSVTIKEPLNDPSNEDVYETTDGTLTLKGTMSDSQSRIVSVFWINEGVDTGFGTFIGSNWTMEDIPLEDGPNAIGALVLDGAGNIGYDILGVQYNSPDENYSLSVSATNGTVHAEPDKRSFAPGTEVTLTSEPNEGYQFDKWSGDASGDENPITITMDSDKSVTASFIEEDGGGSGDEGPDLVIENAEVNPESVTIGDEINISYTIANQGNENIFGHADGNFWHIEYYLSNDQLVSDDDTNLGNESYNSLLSLEPGWNEEITIDEEIPNIDPGIYYILIVADESDNVAEIDEANNMVSISFTLESIIGGDGPDLVIEDANVEPVEASPGDEIGISYILANRGNMGVNDFVGDDVSTWETAHYLSVDDNLDKGVDIRLGDVGEPGPNSGLLAPRRDPGWTNDIDTEEQIPEDIDPGDYFILIVADDENEVQETNEGNNAVYVPFKIIGDNSSDQSEAFITTWKTDNPGTSNNNQITIPTTGSGYDYDISWEEVGNSTNNGVLTGQNGNSTITFPSTGTYRVAITGDFPRFHFNLDGDKMKLLTIEQWGEIAWTSMNSAFAGAKNLKLKATDIPDLSNVTDMAFMFSDADSFTSTGSISNWDVSNVTDMTWLFIGAELFNQDLSNWNVSNVTKMHSMFSGAKSFNQDISGWDVSNVTTMRGLFQLAHSFNQDISGWDVGNVEDMRKMFVGAKSFNQDLSSWDVSNVETMVYMFIDATSFNQDIGSWNLSSVTDMSDMLNGTNLSVENYDSTLIGWANQTVQNDVELGVNGLTYCEASEARQTLIDDYDWKISGDNHQDSCLNNAPTFTEILPDTTVNKGELLEFKFEAEDADGDDLIFSLEKGPEEASIDSETGMFSWEIIDGDNGMYSITVSVSDGTDIVSTSADITVNYAVSNENEQIPEEFILHQNYPNPFNPTTQISYRIPEGSNVTIEVFNALGQKVSTLINEQKGAGSYTATFQAGSLTSGIYIYQIRAGNFAETKKMMLIK